MPEPAPAKDFFISYTGDDRDWAEWLAWTLEAAGYSVIIQAWDFDPGGNFVLDMHNAIRTTERTVLVLSPDYMESDFAASEWAATFRTDPAGRQGRLLPVRVAECTPEGLLGARPFVDLVGLNEDEAARQLLAKVRRGRAKPHVAPSFPPSQTGRPAPIPYPPGPGLSASPTPRAHRAGAPDGDATAGDGVYSHFPLKTHMVGGQPLARYEMWYRDAIQASSFSIWQAGSYIPLDLREKRSTNPSAPDMRIPLVITRILGGNMPREAATVADLADVDEKQAITVQQALQTHKRVFMLGDPGSGKTTTLRRLTYELAAGEYDPREALPLYLNLSTWTGGSTFAQWLREEMSAWKGGEVLSRPEFLAQYLASGKLVLLLDALNEIAERELGERLEELAEFLAKFRPAYCIIACRVVDFRRLSSFSREGREDSRAVLSLLTWPSLVIEPLSDKLVRNFLLAYLGQEAGEALGDLLLPEEPTDWLRRRAETLTPRLREMARNPFFLAVIVTVYKTSGGLSQRLGILLNKFVDIAVAREMGENWLGSSSDFIFRRALEQLAYTLVSNGEHGTAVSFSAACEMIGAGPTESRAVLDLALKTNTMVLEAQGQLIRFSHQLILEFFASKEYGKRVETHAPMPLGPAWGEVAMLHASALEDASDFLTRLAASDPSLAARCYGMGGAQIDDVARAGLIRAFVHDNIGHRRGWLFDDYFGEAAIPVFVELLMTSQDEAYEVAIDALASMGSPAIKPLVELLGRGHEAAIDPRRAREGAALALTRLHADETLIRFAAARPDDAEALSYAAWALGWIGGARAVDALATLAQTDNPAVALEATRALSHADAVEQLLKLADHPNAQARFEVVTYLGSVRGETHLSVLFSKLESDPAPFVRGAAARAIAATETKDPQAIAAFTRALHDPDREVSFEAQRGLKYINTAESLGVLRQFQREDN